MEGVHALAAGNLIALSEQQLIACSTKNNGCNGGWMNLAFNYIFQNCGICSESNYSYSVASFFSYFNEMMLPIALFLCLSNYFFIIDSVFSMSSIPDFFRIMQS